MLAIQQAYEVKAGIVEYLKATFTFRDKEVDKAFYDFINDPVNGMFKGPYVSLKLPFKKAESTEVPFQFSVPFAPFAHQSLSFQRLTSEKGHQPQPTLLTTGTGSGKTESFLYPILDYCLRNKSQQGIKAIILYPMNALATDQAKRLAETIHDTEELKKAGITAGLLIGQGKNRKKFNPDMQKDRVIENREVIVNQPPDILLTNFKMLDIALMRAEYDKLWRDNYEDNDILKFLVLDELHTYDGAQGSDVANLIRRLKLKLGIPKGTICPVGTSATIGSGNNSKELLADYATKVYGEDFNEESIIEEHRLAVEEYFPVDSAKNFIPTPYLLKEQRLENNDNYESYLQKQMKLWGIDPSIDEEKLGEELKHYKLVQDIVAICSEGIQSISELVTKLSRKNREFASLDGSSKDFDAQQIAIRSILSLIGKAKQISGTKKFPFLYLQVQLWIRELSGVARKFQKTPAFTWTDQKTEGDNSMVLPTYYCRECGTSGWMGIKHENKNRIEKDYADAIQKYFANSANCYFINTHKPVNVKADEYEPSDALFRWIDQESLNLYSAETSSRFEILAYRKLKNNYILNVCPCCNSQNTLAMIGTRIGTLSSIATSQSLSSDLDITRDKNRKVLAFTNGVQDAAHQAGFIQSRNFRFTLRTAIQKLINEHSGEINLSSLQEEFINYWSANADDTGQKPLEAYFYKFFPPDHMGDIDIEAFKRKEEDFDPKFLEEYNNRIRWEIASEFGYNSLIGRTLEKTGSSASYFKIESIKKVYERLKPWMDANALQLVEEGDFIRLALGFLYRLRTRGGVDHKYLNQFRTGKSNYYLLTQNVNKHYFLMHNFGKYTRLPKFITDSETYFDVFDYTTQSGNKRNWYHEYFAKTFSDKLIPTNKELVNEFYTELLKILESKEVGILDRKNAQGVDNLAIQPEALFIGNEVGLYACSKCGHELHVSILNGEETEGMPCLNHACAGKYTKQDIQDLENYYRLVYSRGRAPRVYSKEHTGLLDRVDRETLEIDFKQRPKPNSINTLVATSTLEMGIDIGTLNSVFNNSVPPLPANFIQRVGRAGRDSGNSLIVNFSLHKPHDQFYFIDPLQMMEGEIHTPGCFLEAKEILRRHFLAFCIDYWSKLDPEKNTFPHFFRHIKLETLNLDDEKLFVNRLIKFIKEHENDLVDAFTSAYDLTDKIQDAFQQLQLALRSNFYENFKKVFINIKEEYLTVQKRIDEIDKEIRDRKLDKNDPERLDLAAEMKNLKGVRKSISARQILEHLTNLGTLPNYAFPETGVILNAQVRKKTGQAEGRDSMLKSIEIVRPARTALRELNPDNYFYSQGYKLKVSGINTYGYKQKVLTYRYCSNCDHHELDRKEVQGINCPKCNDQSWSSSTNVHKMAKMDTVLSFENEKKAIITDKGEERDQLRSNISLHINFDQKSLQGAWATQKIPFGIEYNKNVSIVEINTGILNDYFDRSRITTLNSNEVPIMGYVVCKHCGKATSSTYNEKRQPKNAEEYHYSYCKQKSNSYQNCCDDTFDEVYFRREFQTEALKILLPVQEFESEASISMFRAGIILGLRKYFQGSPDHLRIESYSEVNLKTNKKDQYLVLYDTIAGGTGYLSDLFNRKNFSEVLKHAYEEIRDCICQKEGKDGCYKCIFSYGNQFEREQLSRKKAEKEFEKIYNSIEFWDYLEEGLGKVTNSGQIEESELEERFVNLFQKHFSKDEEKELGNTFQPLTEDGITKYLLNIQQDNFKYLYEIRPQVTLGIADGLNYTTRPDFIISCLSVQENEVENESIRKEIKPIAIYMDGYTYHAQAPNNRFMNDLLKRQDLLKSNKYITWTMTWNDLDLFIEEKENKDDIYQFYHDKKDFLNKVKHPLFKDIPKKDLMIPNSLERLIDRLKNPAKDHAKNTKVLLALQQSTFGKYFIKPEDAKSFSENLEGNIDSIPLHKANDACLYLDVLPSSTEFNPRLFSKLTNFDCFGVIHIDEPENSYDKKGWEYFWRLYNLLQDLHPDIEYKSVGIEQTEPTQEKDEQTILDNFFEEYHGVVRSLIKKGVAFNEEDYFSLEDETGSILCEAFLGLPDKKIVIDPLDDGSWKEFEKRGFKVYKLEDFSIDIIK